MKTGPLLVALTACLWSGALADYGEFTCQLVFEDRNLTRIRAAMDRCATAAGLVPYGDAMGIMHQSPAIAVAEAARSTSEVAVKRVPRKLERTTQAGKRQVGAVKKKWRPALSRAGEGRGNRSKVRAGPALARPRVRAKPAAGVLKRPTAHLVD